MTTVAEAIDRLYVQTLTPPDSQPAIVHLGEAITTTTESFTLGSWAVPEDEWLMRQGGILENGHELMRVVAYTTSTGVTVQRGAYSTTPEAASIDSPLFLNPLFPRSVVFEAFADNVTMLYPELASIETVELIRVSSGGVFPMRDPLAVEVVEAWEGGLAADLMPVDARIVSNHPMTDGRAILANSSMGVIWVRYRRRMGVVTSEADVLEDDLGVDRRWLGIVLAGTAADVMAGRDIPATQSEFIKATLEAESVRVGSRQNIAIGLARYRDLLLERAKREMVAEDDQKISMHFQPSYFGHWVTP